MKHDTLMEKPEKQAEFVRWMGSLLDALRALGGKASPRETSDWIAEQLALPKELIEAKLKSGNARFHNQVQWARQYLAWEGLIDSTQRGVWTLTPKGAKTRLDEHASRELFLKWVDIHKRARDQRRNLTDQQVKPGGEEKELPEEVEEQTLLDIIQSLPPEGFERLCKRVLHEFGFERVTVVGKSHDGGIDGLGTLRLNPFVSIKVVFQCKRYRGAVGRPQVGEFRNAMLGRAEKGIFITTGYFTAEAVKEAQRDGVPPVELVDGERLLELFEAKQLGLKPKQAFEIDQAFFDQFR
jgi:restriction system protein